MTISWDDIIGTVHLTLLLNLRCAAPVSIQIQVPVHAFDEYDGSNTTASLSSARRVAPSVSGGSRRMSLSAPVRVLQSKSKDGEGDGESANVRKRYVLLFIDI